MPSLTITDQDVFPIRPSCLVFVDGRGFEPDNDMVYRREIGETGETGETGKFFQHSIIFIRYYL